MNEENKHIDTTDTELIRFINGETGEKESDRLYHLINSNSSVKARYKELMKSVSDYDNHFLDDKFDSNKAKANFLEQIEKEDADSISQTRKPIMLLWTKVAAAIILIVVPLLYYMTSRTKIDYIAEDNNIESLFLPDNSEVWVNSGSHLRYPKKFKRKQRNVELVGEAFFNVEPNGDKPFFIHTPTSTIKVTGTSLNVRDYPNDTSTIISVAEGNVEVYNIDGKFISAIQAGEQCQILKNSYEWKINKIEDKNFQSWRTGIIKFRETYLEDAVRIISQYYNTPIEITDTSLLNKQINSTFSGESLNSVLEILSLIHDLSIIKGDSIIYISSAKP